MTGSAGKILLAGAALFFFPLALGRGADAKKELEGVQQRMEKEKRGLSRVQKKEGSILEELEEIEETSDLKGRELRRLNERRRALRAEIRKKERESEKIQKSLGERREFLKKRAEALYRWQRGGSPFVLLNGAPSLADLMRRKRYLERVLGRDQQMISELREESARQASLKEELEHKKEELEDQRKALLKVNESIRAERKKKKEILASLRREKEGHQRLLSELEQAAHRLQTMMDEISRRAAPISLEPSRSGRFETMKGKLELPIRGEVKTAFGKSRHPEFSTEIFHKGIDIEARQGEEIKAVEGGKVVFADRLTGYGKMMIIDHGQRYYTIYAHLSDLLKKTGESVQRGEAIGLAGEGDSLTGTRLYFELRKDGKPLNPLPWFKRP